MVSAKGLHPFGGGSIPSVGTNVAKQGAAAETLWVEAMLGFESHMLHHAVVCRTANPVVRYLCGFESQRWLHTVVVKRLRRLLAK